jgi:hypothetical protein
VTVAKCSGKSKSGAPCKAKAGPFGKCAMHSGKNRAQELARKSAESRKQARQQGLERFAATAKAPKSPEELVAELGSVFKEVKAGTLDENLGRALATVGNSLLKAFEVIDVKKQLVEIEKLLRERV